ncbi:hypothetical protein ACFL08_00935 [Patescibacteria group bacterium]
MISFSVGLPPVFADSNIDEVILAVSMFVGIIIHSVALLVY